MNKKVHEKTAREIRDTVFAKISGVNPFSKNSNRPLALNSNNIFYADGQFMSVLLTSSYGPNWPPM